MQASSALRERPFPPDDARSLVLLSMNDRVAAQTWIDAAALFEPKIRVVVLSGESRYAATCRLRPNLVVEEGRDFGEPTPGRLFMGTAWLDPRYSVVPDVFRVLQSELGALGRSHVPSRPLPPDRRSHVLFVDDEVVLLRSYFRSLGRLRRQVRFSTARTGLEAIEVLEREPVDVMLTNHNMPKMTGHELLKWVRAHSTLSRLHVMVASGGHKFPGAVWEELHPDYLLLKPVELKVLRAALCDCLERATGVPHPFPPKPTA